MTQRKLIISIVGAILLILCFVITTFAIVYSTIAVENNIFSTAKISINLNGGQTLIRDGELLFEPGMTVEKNFFVENAGTEDIYYKLYFQKVTGGLADFLEIIIKDGDKVLYSGTAHTLNRQNTPAADDVLSAGERRELTITFFMPSEVGNQAQGMFLGFDFAADATQVRNNADKVFN